MAFGLGEAIGLGTTVLGGLFGGSAAKRAAAEAQRRRDAALASLMYSGDEQYQDELVSGRRGLNEMAGGLRDALTADSEALGDAMAGAGVYNSSATAGAIQKQAEANTSALTKYASQLSDRLAEIRNQNRSKVASMQYGQATDDYNRALTQEDSAWNAITGAVSYLPSLLGGGSKTSSGGGGTDFGVLTNGDYGAYGSGFGAGGYGGADNSYNFLLKKPSEADPYRSALGATTQNALRRLSVPTYAFP